MKRPPIYLGILIFFITATIITFKMYKERKWHSTQLKSLIHPTKWAKICDFEWLEREIGPLKANFICAIKNNDLNQVKQLIARGIDVNFLVAHDQPHHGFSPLAVAIANNSSAIAQLLIDAGANVNESLDTAGISDEMFLHPANDVRNNTILAYAIILNLPNMVRLLLQNDADVNLPDPIFKRWTPLMIARYNNRKEIEKMLIDAGAK